MSADLIAKRLQDVLDYNWSGTGLVPSECRTLLDALAAKDAALRAELEHARVQIENTAQVRDTLYRDLDRVKAQLERARKALEDAEDTLRLVERPSFRDPRYGDEVEALGLRIGYGALMSSASASWRAHLAADGDPVGGEFVAGPCHATVISTLAKIRAARAASQDEGEER